MMFLLMMSVKFSTVDNKVLTQLIENLDIAIKKCYDEPQNDPDCGYAYATGYASSCMTTTKEILSHVLHSQAT